MYNIAIRTDETPENWLHSNSTIFYLDTSIFKLTMVDAQHERSVQKHIAVTNTDRSEDDPRTRRIPLPMMRLEEHRRLVTSPQRDGITITEVVEYINRCNIPRLQKSINQGGDGNQRPECRSIKRWYTITS